eukprot:scaffold319402_cov15-Tisochrysis_lutea.AAC.1
MTEYESEGIDWTKVEFVDNQECVDVIEQAPPKCGSCICTSCMICTRPPRSISLLHVRADWQCWMHSVPLLESTIVGT